MGVVYPCGHPRTDENTYVDGRGKKMCVICQKRRMALFQAKRAAKDEHKLSAWIAREDAEFLRRAGDGEMTAGLRRVIAFARKAAAIGESAMTVMVADAQEVRTMIDAQNDSEVTP